MEFAVVSVGRNEETYSGYAEGMPVENYPSRRRHKQINHLFNGKRYTLSPVKPRSRLRG
jgi:hypothetical protein